MVKQPKYFVSKTKDGDVVPVVSVEAKPPQPVFILDPRSSRLQELVGKYRHFTTRSTLFSLSLGILATLATLTLYSTGYLAKIKPQTALPTIFARQAHTGVIVAQAQSGDTSGLRLDMERKDARIEIVSAFLARYKSPLQPHEHYAKALVEAADRYNLDYRLLPAIMMQESNLCKAADPSLHNCLGFGIHERGTLGFDSYEEGFDRAARELKANYIDRGLTTPEKIMKKYTPSSNGSWANSVNQWIAEMEHNDRDTGKTSTDDANLLEYTAR